MDYNSIFRVFDNEGETVDRYTVFLASDPDYGSLGLSDDPTHPQGFSQWGDFDIDQVESINTEISFADLPDHVQDYIVDQFELNEVDETDVWSKVIQSLMDGNTRAAEIGIKGLIIDKYKTLTEGPETLNELMGGILKFRGDDVLVKGKVIGTLVNDLNDHKRGVVFTTNDGDEYDFATIPDLIKFIMDEYRIRESYTFKITDDQRYLIRPRGNPSASEVCIFEATDEQKYIVKSLRKLGKKLELPQPRFNSLPGKSNVVELTLRDVNAVLPNELRKRVAVKVLNVVPTSFTDVDCGTVTPKAITLNVPQWEELLRCYDIPVERPITEE